MEPADLPSLVDADWLHGRLQEPRLRVLDASWHLPGSGRDAAAEFRAAHIPGAAFFDIDRIADPESPLPHMLPPADRFAAAVGALGVGSDDAVVVYDSRGLFSAARAWWMFRAFGHERVAILDGGLPAWRARDLPLEAGAAAPRPGRFHARPDPEAVQGLVALRANLESGAAQVVDARPAGRFTGAEPEPRPGLRRGHIPGASNVPFDRVTDPETGRVRPPAALRELFAHLDRRPVVCSCGTGVTACVLAFALHRLGREDVAVYDGSWTEWGGRDDTPVATGADDA
ncbi:MAG: 3-mercaptopyruvate sulfurtransferase [Halofilum sp. (in: g-proteobacteria)]|nr:3-mercaptopyruvate sulfurtransferase [Halofilum sp. (in: g-proteobacteria)]